MQLLFTSLLLTLAPTLYLTEKTDLSKRFIELVEKEKRSIKMASHRLSDVEVINALIAAHKKGIKVEVLVDPITVTAKSPIKLLAKEGVSIWVWKGEKKKGQMRHGFCLFGEEVSWSGSYSFSLKRLYSHKESALLLEEKEVAHEFLGEFEKMKKEQAVPFSEYSKKNFSF